MVEQCNIEQRSEYAEVSVQLACSVSEYTANRCSSARCNSSIAVVNK
jgi:hypothetical protein